MIYPAKFISLALGPVVLWPATVIIFLWKTNLPADKRLVLLPVLLLLQAVIPLAYVLLAFKHKKISDLDLTKRNERYTPLLITFICLLISLPFIYFLGNKTLVYLFALLSLLLLVNGFITLFWKISFHMALDTVFVLLVNYLFHWTLPILYLTIPLVFWSRLTLKKHTIAQLIGGLVLNGVIIMLFLKYVPSP